MSRVLWTLVFAALGLGLLYLSYSIQRHTGPGDPAYGGYQVRSKLGSIPFAFGVLFLIIAIAGNRPRRRHGRDARQSAPPPSA